MAVATAGETVPVAGEGSAAGGVSATVGCMAGGGGADGATSPAVRCCGGVATAAGGAGSAGGTAAVNVDGSPPPRSAINAAAAPASPTPRPANTKPRFDRLGASTAGAAPVTLAPAAEDSVVGALAAGIRTLAEAGTGVGTIGTGAGTMPTTVGAPGLAIIGIEP